MKKTFTKQEIRDLLNKVIMDEVGFTRMVEILNERVSERVSEAEKPCVEDIPKRKFKVGDKVRIKNGISSRTVQGNLPSFHPSMDGFIGITMTVNRYTDMCGYVLCNESGWRFAEDWLEPYVEELKKGDLAIFWDANKGTAMIGKYDCLIRNVPYPHKDNRGNVWKNAIKFESIEQYRKLLKGEK